jgi:hypothetical protein
VQVERRGVARFARRRQRLHRIEDRAEGGAVLLEPLVAALQPHEVQEARVDQRREIEVEARPARVAAASASAGGWSSIARP